MRSTSLHQLDQLSAAQQHGGGRRQGQEGRAPGVQVCHEARGADGMGGLQAVPLELGDQRIPRQDRDELV